MPKTRSATSRAVEQYPTDVQRDRQRHQASAQRDEESYRFAATTNSHVGIVTVGRGQWAVGSKADRRGRQQAVKQKQKASVIIVPTAYCLLLLLPHCSCSLRCFLQSLTCGFAGHALSVLHLSI